MKANSGWPLRALVLVVALASTVLAQQPSEEGLVRQTVETYLHFMLLAARNGVTVPSHIIESVRRMVEFLVAVRQPAICSLRMPSALATFSMKGAAAHTP